MTSLAFMLLLVPDPVWNTSTGNCSSYRPCATSAAAAWIAAERSAGMAPSSWFAAAAAFLIRPSARMNARGILRPLGGKFWIARWVCAPQSAVAGTSSAPMLSCSTR